MRKNLFIIIGILLVLTVGVFASSANLSQNMTVTVLPFIKINSPINNSIYSNRLVLLDLSSNGGPTQIDYSDNGKPFVILCKNNCGYFFYNRTRLFDDGQHNLSIFFEFGSFNTYIRTINFIVDSKKPLITDTFPKTDFANGTFTVKFQEVNPTLLLLNYGNNQNGFVNTSINLKNCFKDKLNSICSLNVNLSEFDQQGISYWFYLQDISGKSGESNKRSVKVDLQKPLINSFDYNITKNQVTFKINISDKNFDKVIFYDNHTTFIPFLNNFKTLCSSLNKGMCAQSRFFSQGSHDVMLLISDKAGNIEEKNVSFVINYRTRPF